MNASQRARRRERRRSAREQARREALAPALDFDAIFSFRALMDSSTTCQRGVAWKGRVQSFTLTRTYQVARLASELAAGEYRKSPAVHFVLNERGCKRYISGVGFRDRVVQRTLCDNSMVPVLCRGIIDDNSASVKGRGMDRARRRFAQQMVEAHRRWGDEAVCVQYDFRSYFASIDSRRAAREIEAVYASLTDDARIPAVIREIVTEERGVGLGNQTSQTCAIWYPSRIDHHIREVLRLGLSGRYMDDGYIFCRACDASAVIESVSRQAESLGLRLHERKTKATPLSKPLTFLKVVFRLDGGMVSNAIVERSLRRTIRHIGAVHGLLRKGLIDEADYIQSVASTYGNILRYGSPKQRRRFEASIPEEHRWKLKEIRIRQCNVPEAKRKIR